VTLVTVVGLGLFGLFGLRRRSSTAVDLDAALAGAQIGLEKKRHRWLLFLIEREEQCLAQMAEASEIDGQGQSLLTGGSNALLTEGAYRQPEDIRAL
jgi:hypothetical protein